MKKKSSKKISAVKKSPEITIDAKSNLVFDSEEELYQHFSKEITQLEREFFSLRNSDVDIAEDEFEKFEKGLTFCLEFPDEIWVDKNTLGTEIKIYLKFIDMKKRVQDEDHAYCHVALCYVTDGVPSFVYLHFPTIDGDLVDRYRRGTIQFDRALLNVPPGAIEGDALMEGDELAAGLYKAMLMIRSEKDLLEKDFRSHADLRESTLEEADEIWRNADSGGATLVTFIKEFHDQGHDRLFYLVVTLEDAPSSSHALLFSFPTIDESLVERYRHGENLQAEEVVQESSH